MANRILRDWTTSERIHNLSAESERFFTRLIMKADDFGRYVANTKLLKASLFPLHDLISDTDVNEWLQECIDNGILKRYSVDGKYYIEINEFGQSGLKVRRAKYPPSSPEEQIELIKGYVYVIGESFDKPVKIGFSMNPWARLKEISANHPENLTVLLSFKAHKRIESLIHLELKHIRVKNEWFMLTDLEVDALKSVVDGTIKSENLISFLRSNYEELRDTTHLETKKKQKRKEEETETETETNSHAFDEKFINAFDEITCESYKLAFKNIDLGAELQKFRIKCDNDKAKYYGRDAGGLRTAFQYQLQNLRKHGKSNSTTEERLNELDRYFTAKSN